jgi:hypothetical protein
MVKLYCIQEFKDAVEKLRNKKPYRGFETEVIEYFFEKKIEEISSGTNLNQSLTTPYIKKRLEGRGGYRLYHLLIIKDNKAYLLYIHPKTGPDGMENIPHKERTGLLKVVYDAITNNNFYSLSCNEEKTELIFTKVKQTITT